MNQYEAEQKIRDLEAELAAANAQIVELQNILDWSKSTHRGEIADSRLEIRQLKETVEALGGETYLAETYEPAQNAHPEGKEAA